MIDQRVFVHSRTGVLTVILPSGVHHFSLESAAQRKMAYDMASAIKVDWPTEAEQILTILTNSAKGVRLV